MSYDVSIKIGGEAGQGIQTVGMLLAAACREAGLYCMAINDFESRIRGGHNFFQIRLSDRQVRAPDNRIHLLVGLDKATLPAHDNELVDRGLALIDSEETFERDNVIAAPITSLAEEAGGKIMANTVAAAACLSLLGASLDFCRHVIEKQFAGKGDDVRKQNLHAAEAGFKEVESRDFSFRRIWSDGKPKRKVISGDQAAGLGALASDCRFSAFYPMSPSTAINLFLAEQKHMPLIVEQAEDEIAALNMAIGASFAGVRSMTATAGGGFCLMSEALGLAGITETPVVIFNCQRPGPATGLATRTNQSDLHMVIRAGQDEFPRFVFAPGSPEHLFEITQKAFHLAEKYQVPAIILTDQHLIDSLYIVGKPLHIPDSVERFIQEKSEPEYKRFRLTDNGVSPRALPCRGEGLVVVTGDEHTEAGFLSEDIDNRNNMVIKRNLKVADMLKEMDPPFAENGNAETLLVGWGSTFGVIGEVVDLLRQNGVNIGHVHLSDMWPFPAQMTSDILIKARRWFSVEQNNTGQIAQLIRQETGLAPHGKILKYDGRPFYLHELYDQVETTLEGAEYHG